MTPDQWLPDETREWLRRASKDLRAAELCATELPAESLFHCQQAAEKFLKAFLTWNQSAFRKTHELRELAMMCVQVDPALESSLEPTIALSQYAWRFRYPGAPYEPDADEAERGRVLAEQVREQIGSRIPKSVMVG
jgi:HEPN domain-containing protein